jgi:hypothetical protein
MIWNFAEWRQRRVGKVLSGTAIDTLVGVIHVARPGIGDRSRVGGNTRRGMARATANRTGQMFPTERGSRSHWYGIAQRDFDAESDFTRTKTGGARILFRGPVNPA